MPKTSTALLRALARLDRDGIAAFRKVILDLASATDDNKAALARISYRQAADRWGRRQWSLSVGRPAVPIAEVLWEVEALLADKGLRKQPNLSAEDVDAVMRLCVLVFALLEEPVGKVARRHRRKLKPQR